MLPVFAFVSLMAVGYYINNQGIPHREQDINKKRNREPYDQLNVYAQKPYEQASVQKMGEDGAKFLNAKNNPKSKLIPRDINAFKTDSITDDIKIPQKEIDSLNSEPNKSSDLTYSSLTGEYVPKESFKHNNMQPFFKKGGEGYRNSRAYESRLGTFTGRNNIKPQRKRGYGPGEQPPLFPPNANMGNVYGGQNYNNVFKQHYVPATKKANVSAHGPPVNVGPGLLDGYKSTGTGGFQQYVAQEVAMPKTTNEMRTLNNPKLSYEGRVVAGSGVSQRGKIGRMGKKTPNGFYINTPDRYFTTTGATVREKMRPKYIVLPKTCRQETSDISYIGPAEASVAAEPVRSLIKKSTKLTFLSDPVRNANLTEFWNPAADNYAKDSYDAPANERQTTEDKTQILNVSSVFKKSIAFNPNDILPTTIKETLLHDERDGNVGNQQFRTGAYVVDPMYAKTTIKETTLSGYVGDPSTDQLGGGGGYMTAPTDLTHTAKGELQAASGVDAHPPTLSSTKMSAGMDKFNIQVDKLDNDRVNVREPQTNKIYNSIPQNLECGNTSLGEYYEDAKQLEARIDPELLNAFRENPYTKSLHSHAFA